MKFAMYFAPGFEECEALIVVDLLRRLGVKVDTISLADKTVVSSHNVPVVMDYLFSEVNHDVYDGYILPGGMPGTTNLGDCKQLLEVIKKGNDNHKLLAAICAAPSIFGKLGLLNGLKATSYPDFKKDLLGATVVDVKCVQDNNIITACGLGAAFEFAKTILLNFKEPAEVDKLFTSIGY